ncbi:MAG: hypothetical protein GXP00_09305 [Alphaproteobacteria bacterium]|nr:hypothetical protein [Alphaproteobacteria bacterium]
MPNNHLSENTKNLDPLINTIKDLTRVITEETNLLKTNRPKELERFLPLKNQLMASYQKEMADLNNRGGLLGSGNGPAIRQLKQESRVFQSVLTRHTRLVKALKTISENMIKTISDEVVKRQNQASRYGADGAKSTNKHPTSITLNQTI